MGAEQLGRIQRTPENLLSQAETVERIDAEDVNTSEHDFVLENGQTVAINRKIRQGNDEWLLLLAGSTSRLFGTNEKVPVVKKK